MTNQEKKAYLMMYQEKWKEIDVLQQEIETLQSRAEKVTSVLSDMPKGGQGDGFVSAVDKIVELKEGLNNKVLEATKIHNEVWDVIETVSRPSEQNILKLRYIDGERWEKIAETLGIGIRWVFRRHKKALKNLQIDH